MPARRRPQTALIEDLGSIPDIYDPAITEQVLFPPGEWRLKDIRFILTLSDPPIRGNKPILQMLKPDAPPAAHHDHGKDQKKK